MASEVTGTVYTIHGVQVHFPCKAYPSQLSMMDKVIKSLQRKQNSLLESPTGSGKSLALLCSALAWQTNEWAKFQAEEHEMREQMIRELDECCAGEAQCAVKKESPFSAEAGIGSETVSKPEDVKKESISTPPKIENAATDHNKTLEERNGHDLSSSSESDDFQPAKKRFRTPGQYTVPDPKKQKTGTSSENSDSPPQWKMEKVEKDSEKTEKGKDMTVKKERTKVPKIYFGTRTHKQIAQIARELGKTAYKHTKMCILSSREHTCVHPEVSKKPNKNEECRELVDPNTTGFCRYYLKVQSLNSQHAIKSYGLDSAWDIEDLVKLGRKVKACPYYVAREILDEADIVFCPYNYLIDPIIRFQMDINLTDQIVVLDEAHNIEDSARESASFTIDTFQMQDMLQDLDKMVTFGVLPDSHRNLHLLVGSLLTWVNQNTETLESQGFEKAQKILTGEEMIRVLDSLSITEQTYQIYCKHLEKIYELRKSPDSKVMHSLTSKTLQHIEGLFLVLDYLLCHNGKFVTDYRIAIMKTAVSVPLMMPNGWRRTKGAEKQWAFSLNFWCLNPAVVFSGIGSVVRSVILSSGTLSPMSSFSSELGEPFPIKMEANHIIGRQQAWISTLSVGPNGSPLNATFRFAETFSFQDQVGQLVLEVCKTVPHGVLCFLPSYSMMDKLCKRWHQTGLWNQMENEKLIVAEPRGGNKSDFDEMLQHFYGAVQSDSDSDEESGTSGGALFFAVCRGKVSEGLDFADKNARAVITIGIPFPNIKDTQVDLKKRYNNQFCAQRGLLSGNEWYEIQAYRALNQALGRCIRHRNDWGAIILVDERFSKSPRYVNGLSKWVRQRVQHFRHFGQAMTSLREFAQARVIDPCPDTQGPNSSILATPSANTSLMNQSLTFTSASSLMTPTHDNTNTPQHNQSLANTPFTQTPTYPSMKLDNQETPKAPISAGLGLRSGMEPPQFTPLRDDLSTEPQKLVEMSACVDTPREAPLKTEKTSPKTISSFPKYESRTSVKADTGAVKGPAKAHGDFVTASEIIKSPGGQKTDSKENVIVIDVDEVEAGKAGTINSDNRGSEVNLEVVKKADEAGDGMVDDALNEFPDSPLLFPDSPVSSVGSQMKGSEAGDVAERLVEDPQERSSTVTQDHEENERRSDRPSRECRSMFKRKRKISERGATSLNDDVEESKKETRESSDADEHLVHSAKKIQKKRTNVRVAKNRKSLERSKEEEDLDKEAEISKVDGREPLSIHCKKCQTLLLSGRFERRSLSSIYLSSLMNRRKLRVLVGDYDSVGDTFTSLASTATDSTEKLQQGLILNTYYCSQESRYYTPLICTSCVKMTSHKTQEEPSVVAAQVNTTSDDKCCKELWILTPSVKTEKQE